MKIRTAIFTCIMLVSLSASADTDNWSGFWTTAQGNHLVVYDNPSTHKLVVSITVDSDDTGRRTVQFEGFTRSKQGGAVQLYANAKDPFPIMRNGKRCMVYDPYGVGGEEFGGGVGPGFDGTGVMIGDVGGRRIHMNEGCFFGGAIRCNGVTAGFWGAKCDGVWR